MIRALDYGVDLIQNLDFFLGMYFNLNSTYCQVFVFFFLIGKRERKKLGHKIQKSKAVILKLCFIYSLRFCFLLLYFLISFKQHHQCTHSFSAPPPLSPCRCNFLTPESNVINSSSDYIRQGSVKPTRAVSLVLDTSRQKQGNNSALKLIKAGRNQN